MTNFLYQYHNMKINFVYFHLNTYDQIIQSNYNYRGTVA
jgi:hypothetical protein